MGKIFTLQGKVTVVSAHVTATNVSVYIQGGEANTWRQQKPPRQQRIYAACGWYGLASGARADGYLVKISALTGDQDRPIQLHHELQYQQVHPYLRRPVDVEYGLQISVDGGASVLTAGDELNYAVMGEVLE